MPNVIYIVGRGHSGSTMLELLINRNPQAVSMGEVNLLGLQLYRSGSHTRWIGECSCHKRPHTCPVWGKVLSKLENDLQVDLKKQPLAFRVSDEGLAEEYGWKRPLHYLAFKTIRAIRILSHRGFPLLGRFFITWTKKRDKLYEAYAEIRQVDTVVDASKDYLQMLDLYKHSRWPVKVIYITRDVRGHAWSSIRKKGATAKEEAKTWTKLNRSILKALEKIPSEDWMHIKYEDICAETDTALAKLFEFAGLPNFQLSAEQEISKRHTIAGNQTRFRLLDTIRHDRKWVSNLTPEDILSIKMNVDTETVARLDYSLKQ